MEAGLCRRPERLAESPLADGRPGRCDPHQVRAFWGQCQEDTPAIVRIRRTGNERFSLELIQQAGDPRRRHVLFAAKTGGGDATRARPVKRGQDLEA